MLSNKLGAFMKFLKIGCVNILLLILVLLSVNFICFCLNLYQYHGDIDKDDLLNFVHNINITTFTDEDYDSLYRKPTVVLNSKKPPVVVFGCSFVEGSRLKDNQTICAKISKLTNRTVYNRGDIGLGSSMMLYSLQTGRIKSIAKDCDTFIYVFIQDHLFRNLSFRCWPFLYKTGVRYELDKNGDLKPIIPNTSLKTVPVIINSSLYRYFEDVYAKKHLKQGQDLTFKIIEKSYSEIQKQFPNSKFIVLDYSADNSLPYREKLEKLGVKIVSLRDLDKNPEKFFTEEYQYSKKDSHPSEKAWDEIVPKFLAFTNVK